LILCLDWTLIHFLIFHTCRAVPNLNRWLQIKILLQVFQFVNCSSQQQFVLT
jgi:hypothetical protein